MTGLLAEKRVLVTGGSRGLGREIVGAFAAHGARVAFTYHKNVEMAEVLVREVEASSAEDRKALAFGVSVLDVAGTDRVVREIQGAWGGIDVLVNNAAITQNLPLPLLEDGVGRNLPDHRRADYLRHCSLGRVGTFAEVAEMAAFLVSDRSSYMTGETVVMDGGV